MKGRITDVLISWNHVSFPIKTSMRMHINKVQKLYKHWALRVEVVIGARTWQYTLETHENLIKNRWCILIYLASKRLSKKYCFGCWVWKEKRKKYCFGCWVWKEKKRLRVLMGEAITTLYLYKPLTQKILCKWQSILYLVVGHLCHLLEF